jgi:hypothetical protein
MDNLRIIRGCSKRPSTSCVVCLVHLVYIVGLVCLVFLVSPVSLVQPNKQDKPNKPNNGLRMLADFFSILLDRERLIFLEDH